MRIGIDARFLTHPQVGGFKTYTQNLVNAMARLDTVNDYVIYVDRPSQDPSLVWQENFTYRVVEGVIPGLKTAVREQIKLPQAISRDRLDLVHFLCNTVPYHIETPFILTLHDTIQVTALNKFHINSDLRQYRHYGITAYSKWTIMHNVGKAIRVITVSDFEKNEIAKHLGVSRNRIFVTHLAPNPIFKPVDQDTKVRWGQELSAELNLPKRFVLAVGYEPRKNIPLVIDAFAGLSAEYPDLSLVIVAGQPQRRATLQKLVDKLNLAKRIVLFGALSPHQLVQLYNLAELFVFPSTRESFGLPPVEAMACGAPTMVYCSSSLPEVVQDGALLVSDLEIQTWAETMKELIGCETLREELRQRGLRRAATLSWDECARKTLCVYGSVG